MQQSRDRAFSTRVFERHRQPKKADVMPLIGMYVNGVCIRKVGKLPERLCGYRFSARTISNMMSTLDAELTAFASSGLANVTIPYLMLHARYEKVRDSYAVGTRAVQIAVAVVDEEHLYVLSTEAADQESENRWETIFTGFRERGLSGVPYVVSDRHEELKRRSRKR